MAAGASDAVVHDFQDDEHAYAVPAEATQFENDETVDCTSDEDCSTSPRPGAGGSLTPVPEGAPPKDAENASSSAVSSREPRKTSKVKQVETSHFVLRVNIISDNCADAKLVDASGAVKPRRRTPTVKVQELLQGLSSNAQGQLTFERPLNGWPAFAGLSLDMICGVTKKLGMTRETAIWRSEGRMDLPTADLIPRRAVALFSFQPWVGVGWAPRSPGFVWWFQPSVPRILHGEGALEVLEAEEESARASGATRIKKIHCFSHKYPALKPTLRDRQTWHTGILVEWSHKRYCTVLELAFRHAVGGFGGKSNWVPDKLESEPLLFKTMPDSFKQPWDEGKAEIRMTDVLVPGVSEFEAFMMGYSNKGGIPFGQVRFVDPVVYESSEVRVRFVGPKELVGYLLNYAARVTDYHQFSQNCQTFTADLFAFLAAKPNSKPVSELVRANYTQRSKAFLYEPGGE